MIKEDHIDFVNQAPGIMCLKDMGSVFQACSPQGVELLGYEKASDIQGTTDFDIKCDAVKGAKEFVLHDQDVMRRGSSSTLNLHTYADGCVTIVLMQKKTLLDRENIVGVTGVGCDVTHVNNIAGQLLSLLEHDGNFITVDQKKSASYTFHDNYPGDGLTPKESICLFYILRGKSNKQISLILSISQRTVEAHVTKIKNKLQCHSRSQLIENSLTKGYLKIIISRLLSNADTSFFLS
jgi:DNA-binding CsgD family transcriptional regulator